MTVSPQPVGSEARNGGLSAERFSEQVREFLAKFGRTTKARSKSALKSIQTGRMMSALSSMNDHQLAQIGISRGDIPNYAEKLMASQ